MKSLITCCTIAGLAEWVCCPGEHNGAVIRALADCPLVHRWSQSDERTAAYFALGRMQATGRPVAIVAGSGSAAAALAPAVVEAYYQRRPLVIITVDPAAHAGAAARPGCIEHEGMFGMYAPSLDITLPCAVSDLPDLSGLFTEGFPIHLNLRLEAGAALSGDYSTLELGDAPRPPRFHGSLVELSQMLRFRAREGLVLIIGALEPSEQEPVLWLAQTLCVPLLAEASSGLREELSALLLHGGDESLCQNPPPYVLRLGDIPTGRFWKQLENLPETEVYSITRTGFSGLSRRSHVIEGEPEQIMKALGDVPHIGDVLRLLRAGRHYTGQVEEALLAAPESEAAMVRYLSNHVCMADVLCLGSGSCTELWNRYAQVRVPTVYLRANTANSGSDGTIASFLGNAADAPFACCFTGDLALLRDLGAAGLLPQLALGKRIVAVLNNGGAGRADSPELDDELRRLMVQPPPYSLAEVARLWGAEYHALYSEADFDILDSLDDNAFVLLDIQADSPGLGTRSFMP